jgi:23S rRNA pseudouridine2605 synthase
MLTSEKLQKVLARAGLGSRRELEVWIEMGRVTVNGQVAKIGDRVEATDEIKVDQRYINIQASYEQNTRMMIYNKPEGEICTRHDPIGRRTVFTTLPRLHDGRWVSVGRLDIKTEGLLLLTNNGEVANRMMHPSYELEREYAVLVFGEVSHDTLDILRNGVMLEDGMAQFDQIIDSGGTAQNHWYYVVIKEGRNREVRRLWESQNVQISRLIRVRFGTIELPRSLRPGQWIELPEESVNAQMIDLGLEPDSGQQIQPKIRKSNFIRSKQRMRVRDSRHGEGFQGSDN